ncbi:MAG: hypothetical protein AB1Z23_01140 [Eubacteriales bacterium]
MNINFTPSLFMAITDYIPVILFFIGSFFFGSFVRRNSSIFMFVLFVIGIAVANFAGFAKATWKLMLATGGRNIVWMDDFQFLFLGIGFVLVFIVVLSIVIKTKKKPTAKSAAAAAIISVKGTSLFYYLLTIVVLSTLGYLSCLIIMSRRLKVHISVVLYIVYAVVSILMGGLSGSGEYEIAHWVAQCINTIGTFSLLIAHINLNKKDLELSKA